MWRCEWEVAIFCWFSKPASVSPSAVTGSFLRVAVVAVPLLNVVELLYAWNRDIIVYVSFKNRYDYWNSYNNWFNKLSMAHLVLPQHHWTPKFSQKIRPLSVIHSCLRVFCGCFAATNSTSESGKPGGGVIRRGNGVIVCSTITEILGRTLAAVTTY